MKKEQLNSQDYFLILYSYVTVSFTSDRRKLSILKKLSQDFQDLADEKHNTENKDTKKSLHTEQ